MKGNATNLQSLVARTTLAAARGLMLSGVAALCLSVGVTARGQSATVNTPLPSSEQTPHAAPSLASQVTAPTRRRPPVQRRRQPATPSTSVVPSPAAAPAAPAAPATPQPVITVVHRLNGWKFLSWLSASGDRVVRVDEMPLAPSVHTNIVAGYVADDGQTVVTRLPQGGAELVPGGPAGDAGSTEEGLEAPDLTVVRPDGARVKARFVGLDGITGLSLLETEEPLFKPRRGNVAGAMAVGQRVRLFAPEPAPPGAGMNVVGDEGVVYAHMSEAEGRLLDIKRAPSGRAMQLTVRADGLTPAWTGAVATDATGALVGIVAQGGTSDTHLLSAEAVRGAVERVRARRASVLQPWLGARGDAVALAPLEQFLTNGWPREDALALLKKQKGVLLTAVAPGTPAAFAGLRPGDVVERVSERLVASVEDLSMLLKEAGGNSVVDFTIRRAQQNTPLKLAVKLSEALNPAGATEEAEARATIARTRALLIEAQSDELKARTAEEKAREEVMRLRGTLESVRVARVEMLYEMRRLLEEAEDRHAKAQKLLDDARKRKGETETQLTVAEKRLAGVNGWPRFMLPGFRLAEGIEAIPMSPQLAVRYNADGGILVVSVRPGSVAAESGLRAGDVIETINGKPLTGTDEPFDFSVFASSDLSLGVVRERSRLTLKIPRTLLPK